MYETAGIITNDDMKHWVNIVGVSSNKNLSWFGGKIVNQFMFKIWNPIGRAILYKSSFSNVGFDNRDYCFWTIEQGQLYVLYKIRSMTTQSHG